MYVKAMYDAWCNGQDQIDIIKRHMVFVKMTCRNFHRSEEEMLEWLKQHNWFLYEKKDEIQI